jgi:hypothetical protein
MKTHSLGTSSPACSMVQFARKARKLRSLGASGEKIPCLRTDCGKVVGVHYTEFLAATPSGKYLESTAL